MWARFGSFLRAWLGRRTFERGLAEELRFHIDAYAADLERAGVSPGEAQRRARGAFGSAEAVRDDCRQARGLRLIDECVQDLRYAVRVMKRTPGFATAAIVSLGLGIGANTSIFSLIDAVLLRSLPVESPSELRFLAHGLGDQPETNSNYPLLQRYRTVDAFAGVTAFRPTTFKVGVGTDVELIQGQYVSGNYHAIVGARIAYGRGFVSEPDRPGGQEDIAVISDAYWTRRFGRSPDVLARTITVQDRTVSIVGVTAPGFGGLEPGTAIDMTLPLSAYVRADRGFLEMHAGFTSMPLVRGSAQASRTRRLERRRTPSFNSSWPSLNSSGLESSCLTRLRWRGSSPRRRARPACGASFAHPC
jgi:hypothetical protein